MAVVTPEERVLETLRGATYRSVLLALAVLSLAIVFQVFLADSLVQPILSLVDATWQVMLGVFSARVPITTRDELALGARSFNEMASVLKERERLKHAFAPRSGGPRGCD